jgi:hypothetical protein
MELYRFGRLSTSRPPTVRQKRATDETTVMDTEADKSGRPSAAPYDRVGAVSHLKVSNLGLLHLFAACVVGPQH